MLSENEKVKCFIDKGVAYSSKLVTMVKPETVLESNHYTFNANGEVPTITTEPSIHIHYNAYLSNNKKFELFSTSRTLTPETENILENEDFCEWLEEAPENKRKDGKSSLDVFKRAYSYANRIRKRLAEQEATKTTLTLPAEQEEGNLVADMSNSSGTINVQLDRTSEETTEVTTQEPVMDIVEEADVANSTVDVVPTESSDNLTLAQIEEALIPDSAPIHVQAELEDLKTVEEEEALQLVSDEEREKANKKLKYIASKLQAYVDILNKQELEAKPVAYSKYKGTDIKDIVDEDLTRAFNEVLA